MQVSSVPAMAHLTQLKARHSVEHQTTTHARRLSREHTVYNAGPPHPKRQESRCVKAASMALEDASVRQSHVVLIKKETCAPCWCWANAASVQVECRQSAAMRACSGAGRAKLQC